ncbi:MAG: protein-disulfide isomerase, partial [Lachnoanaerobaculum sp.]
LAFEAVPSYRFGDKIAASGGGLLVDIHEVEELIK